MSEHTEAGQDAQNEPFISSDRPGRARGESEPVTSGTDSTHAVEEDGASTVPGAPEQEESPEEGRNDPGPPREKGLDRL